MKVKCFMSNEINFSKILNKINEIHDGKNIFKTKIINKIKFL